MKSIKRSQQKISLLFALIFIGLACNLTSPGASGDTMPVGTNTPTSTVNDSAGVSPTRAPEAVIENTTADSSTSDSGDEFSNVFLPFDYFELLNSHVENDIWEEEEGIVLLLKLMAGEITDSDLPADSQVETQIGTGLIHHALDLLEADAVSGETASEIIRLMNILAPSRETLDKISEPAESAAIPGGHLARPAALQEQSCEDLSAQGFKEVDTLPGQVCFKFVLLSMAQGDYRIYYPADWEGQEDKMAWVNLAQDAIIDSITVYSTLGDVRDAYIVFSQRTEFGEGTSNTTAAYQIPAWYSKACSVGLYQLAVEIGEDKFKQILAHELFHCFQDWTLFSKPFSEHSWWGEGSAEYFSNVVYPEVNLEHRVTQKFNVNSATESLTEMAYENAVFFQHLANHFSNQEIIDLLQEMSLKGGASAHEDYLAGLSYMPGLFQDLFITFATTGVKDTIAGVFKPGKFYIPDSDTKTVTKESTVILETDPFIGTRLRIEYDKEKRFVQMATEDGEGNYGMALEKLLSDRSAWSATPPEIRSSCEDESPYVVILTSLKDGYKVTTDISKVEKAECDPCLLGSWDINHEQFQAYITGLMEQQGGGDFDIFVDGHYYVTFKIEGQASSIRSNLAVGFKTSGGDETGLPAGQTFTTVTNAHGEGDYSADGETLTMIRWLDVLDNVTGYIDDQVISVGLSNMNGGMVNASFFGTEASGPISIGPAADQSADKKSSYTCDNESLVLTAAEGTISFFRVEEIPPTPVPTAFPEGNPSP